LGASGVACLAIAAAIGLWWLALVGTVFLSVALAHRFFQIASNHKDQWAFDRLERTRTIADLHRSVSETLILAIDAKELNQGYVIRVPRYAERLAEAMGLPDEEVEGVAAAALLHDIGKLGVPDHILKKRAPLTAEEMAEMRLHAQIGADIISNVHFSSPVVEAVRHHHERHDGSGYPSGLRGDQIPLAARILAVVDSYESHIVC
jgi:putative nucleotidyltransferase with HDIG domain